MSDYTTGFLKHGALDTIQTVCTQCFPPLYLSFQYLRNLPDFIFSIELIRT